MELSQVLGGQYAFHGLVAGFVLVLAVLVFAFGFKSAEEPPFDKLSGYEERRAAGKKRKPKEKKSQMNGHVTAVTEGKKSDQKAVKKEDKKETEKSPLKEKAVKQEKKSPTKTNKDAKDNLNEVDRKVKGKGKENVELKSSKKNKIVEEKPKDFDDGEWEQALSRKDKKNRKTALEEIQPKSEKKKEKKKAREEVNPALLEPEEQLVEPEPSKNEMLPQEKPSEQQPEVQPTVVDEKTKKPKKKKSSETQNIAESLSTVEKQASTDSPSAPKPTMKVEASETLPLNSEFDSSLAFDELGDTWKEARAPKKSNKKKSRKD